ncbi:hypothetical protein P7C71_g6506, partial [Lecanoromycetidae sp. Uapishka_2]
MSFGFGVGDFIAVGKLCLTVYNKCKESPSNYNQLSSEVGALHNVIKKTEELSARQNLTSEQESELAMAKLGCEEVLTDLDNLLSKYESLGTNSQGKRDRVGSRCTRSTV